MNARVCRFGRTDIDDEDIILPLRQCCVIRPSTLSTLLRFYAEPQSLTKALHRYEISDNSVLLGYIVLGGKQFCAAAGFMPPCRDETGVVRTVSMCRRTASYGTMLSSSSAPFQRQVRAPYKFHQIEKKLNLLILPRSQESLKWTTPLSGAVPQ